MNGTQKRTIPARQLRHKQVQYMGAIYQVPTWARYIGMNRIGEVYVFEERPYWYLDSWRSDAGRWDHAKLSRVIDADKSLSKITE